MAPVKICMIVFNEFRPDMRVYNEAVMLGRQDNFEVNIIALKKREEVPEEETMRGGVSVKRIAVTERELHLNFFSPLYHTKTMPLIYHRVREEHSDIYHCHDIYTLPLGVKLKHSEGARVVYDAHEPDYGTFMAAKPAFGLPPSVRRTAANIYERASAAKLDRMIVTTEFAKQAKLDLGYSVHIDVIPYRANPEFFKPELISEDLQEKYRGKRVIIFIGNIGETKGFFQMLEAFKTVRQEVKNAFLLIAGEVVSWLEHETKIKEMGLTDCVEVTGYMPYWDVAPYVNLAEVGLMLSSEDMPNYRLTLPNKIMDYMACGKPFIGSKLPQVQKIVEEEHCGILVDSMKPDQIASAMLELLNDRSKARKMGERGLKAVSGNYSWEAIEKRLIKIYKGLTNKD
ncbi:MAG: glycosyltransferase family 4 protein [Thermoplasmata archaeon]|nr:MAG: glycosyltransferase family 4 protein [Thermoplasmata archaeon]